MRDTVKMEPIMKKLFLSFLFTLPFAPSLIAMKNDTRSFYQQELDNQLLAAAEKNDLEQIQLLLYAGANPNVYAESKFSQGLGSWEPCESILMRAARNDNLALCRLLLENGANPNLQNFKGATTPFLVSKNGNIPRWPRKKEICSLLFEYGADQTIRFFDLGEDPNPKTQLGRAAICNDFSRCKIFVTHAVFNPVLTPRDFHQSRQRIYTALLVFKRCCSKMPKDIRKLILCNYEPGLKKDFLISGACGIYKNKESDVHHLPLLVIRLLVQNGQLDPQKTVLRLVAFHIEKMRPIAYEAWRCIARPYPMHDRYALMQLLDPETFKENNGKEIEEVIIKRLGLEPSIAEKIAAVLPEAPCITQ